MDNNASPKMVRRGSIRPRLILVIVLLVTVPLLVITLASVSFWQNATRDQVIAQLQSVASLKEKELETWVTDIHLGLSGLLVEPANAALWPALLQDQGKTDPTAYHAAVGLLQKRFQLALENSNLFDEFFLIDANGAVLVSTDASQQGLNKATREYFKEGLKSFYLNPPYNEATLGKLSMAAALPVTGADGQALGVLGASIDMRKLSDVMLARAGLGLTGQTYLVLHNHALLTESRFPGWDFGSFVFSTGINDAIEKYAGGAGSYLDYRDVPVLGVFRWLPDLQMVMLAEQSQSEALQAAQTTLVMNLLAAVIALLVAWLAAMLAARQITQPIGELAQTAEKIASGHLELETSVKSRDEIGVLATAFNSMTSQLRLLIGGLEQKVTERTQLVERRSLQLQAAADIARDAAQVHDLQTLLDGAVNMIRDRLGFYHAGIFLVDERGEYAILRAATGLAGRTLIAKGHRLRVGEVGIVGYVTGNGKPRIALDVGADATYFKNPVLPETRSEMALPLMSGERVIGALDVQSTAPSAFDKEDIRALQTMADQLAIAIENARLFQEMETALRDLEYSQGLLTRKAWQGYLQHAGGSIGYHASRSGVEPIASEAGAADKERQVGEALSVPIKVRNQVLGSLKVRFTEGVSPKEAEATYQEIAARLSVALENARLFEETQRRAEREHLVAEITGKLRQSNNPQQILEMAREELRQALRAKRAEIKPNDEAKK